MAINLFINCHLEELFTVLVMKTLILLLNFETGFNNLILIKIGACSAKRRLEKRQAFMLIMQYKMCNREVEKQKKRFAVLEKQQNIYAIFDFKKQKKLPRKKQ
ncbi:hypothetical protein T4D_14514 [Trichinella pseudospiralis]|uniref:Uncharacterized protein n=1 Tax=Trichinella pseudospiralis TaxID=6337 RepID=A0A0V1FUV0_TRIPS|nr:hypothetical protein T4D_14514 [Trichinella pseudospiralis]